MQINVRFGKNFQTQYNKMQADYGEELARLNGFADEQLSYGDFIDNFIDEEVVADVSIDSNSNVRRKDVVTLLSEMPKPHRKLMCFNKIYYEMQKEYGFKAANEFLQREWTGETYLHDADTATFKSYCIMPDECCTFILDGKKIYTSLNRIYQLLPEQEMFDEEQGVYYKKPKNLQVLDYDKEKGQIRYTRVLCVSNKETEKDFFFTKLQNGSNIITTQDHKLICVEGEIPAQELTTQNFVYSNWDESLFTNSIYVYNGLELTEELGYIIGMYLAEGFNDKGQLNICQSYENSYETWVKITDTLTAIGIPYSLTSDKNRIRMKNGDNNWERKISTICQGKYCDEKRLCEDFVHFNDEFLKGFLAGMIDGDGTIAQNKTCMIRLTSRALINQIRAIGLHFGIYFGSRTPYIQSQKA